MKPSPVLSRTIRALAAIAALSGAAGVGLAALGAHAGANGGRLITASTMLLFHAAAALGALSLGANGQTHPLMSQIAAGGMIAGAALFAGALAMTQLTGHSLFPMAAPTGGGLTLLSWLALAAAALWPQNRTG